MTVVAAIAILWSVIVKQRIVSDDQCENIFYCIVYHLHDDLGLVYVGTFFLFFIPGFVLYKKYRESRGHRL